MEHENNYTHHVDSKSVQVWSRTRLPFEPKGWLKDLREQIRQDLKHLKLGREGVLYASYVSSEKRFCDVENVLFYNVGPNKFDNLTKNGLIFERGFAEPPKLDKFSFPHFQQYSIEKNSFSYWKPENELAAFSSASVNFSNNTKVDDVWYSLKRGNIKSLNSAKIPQYFGLNIEVNSNKKMKISSILKVLLDGIISAFQCHLNNDTPSLFDVTSKRLGIDSEKVKELLLDKKNAILGSGKLIHKRSDSIQWNPKDDGLVAVEIIPKYSNSIHTTFSGNLFSVKNTFL